MTHSKAYEESNEKSNFIIRFIVTSYPIAFRPQPVAAVDQGEKQSPVSQRFDFSGHILSARLAAQQYWRKLAKFT
ncbi:MAG: hypothetical protein AAF722_10890 [Cyanobacteria bacterium P01_C01_bin.70]